MYVFTNKYINEFQSSESDEGMKKILKLSNFLNFLKKGLGTPTMHPNLQLKILKKSKIPTLGLHWAKIFGFFKIFSCRFGCIVGVPSPFFKKIQKV